MAYDVADGLAWYLQLLAAGIAIYALIAILFFVLAYYNVNKSEVVWRVLASIGKKPFPRSMAFIRFARS